MVEEPKTSRYQIVSSMTPDELLSEGYADIDDFYDPEQEEEAKKALALLLYGVENPEEIEQSKQILWSDDEEDIEF